MNKIVIPAVIALVVSGTVSLFNIGASQSNQAVQGLSSRDVQAVSLKVGSPTQKFNVNSSGTIIGLGTTTPTTSGGGEIVVDSTGTTTLNLQSSASTKGSCIQMETTTGGTVRATVVGTTWTVAAGLCE